MSKTITKEGYVLVPKEPTEEMLRAPWLNDKFQTQDFSWLLQSHDCIRTERRS